MKITSYMLRDCPIVYRITIFGRILFNELVSMVKFKSGLLKGDRSS